MRIQIVRLSDNGKQTLGRGFVFSGIHKIFEFTTLELPWKNNEKRISCIPPGAYNVNKRISPKFGQSFHIKDVENRSYILIHAGNYNDDTLGCILVGDGFIDIDKDGLLDIYSSKDTLRHLNNLMTNEFTLSIS